MLDVFYRGSRKHVLDWTDQPRFLPELLELVKPVNCRVTSGTKWQPMGPRDATEARLDQFGPRAFPDDIAWTAVSSWWLRHTGGANTPNWDIAVSCEVEGVPGLILVEAKANIPELSSAGKPLDLKATERTRQNHEQIGEAIAEACAALLPVIPGIAISRDSHYQLSNRIAFGWKLASLGIPVVLVYLGFTGDTGIDDVGAPFTDDEHWQCVMRSHLAAVCPLTILDGPTVAGTAPFWFLSRSRPVLSPSPPVDRPAKVGWEEVADLAHSFFDVWTGHPEVRWANKGWSILESKGLTRFRNASERDRVRVRLIALAAFYHSWCQSVWQEGGVRSSEWFEEAGISELSIGQLTDPDLVGDDILEPEDFPELAKDALLLEEYETVSACLQKEFRNDSLLFLSLWRSRDFDDESESQTRHEILNEDITAEKLAGLNWIESGCPIGDDEW